MLELPLPEKVVFAFVFAVYVAAAIVGVLQLRARGDKFKHLLVPLIALAVSLETVILIFRAVAIKSFPLTGLFESMIVLGVVFGLIYLLFTIPIRQVWFGTAMSWVLLAVTILAAIVARPPSAPSAVATTPWAISHGVAMILSGVAIMLAAASGILYLLSERSLKQKKVVKLLGRMPNIEKLERMNEFGLKAGFVLLTIGLASGIGLAVTISKELEIHLFEWLVDPKMILILSVWLLLAVILILRRLGVMGTKLRMYITIIAVALILFAIVGTTMFCGTKHDFSTTIPKNVVNTR